MVVLFEIDDYFDGFGMVFNNKIEKKAFFSFFLSKMENKRKTEINPLHLIHTHKPIFLSTFLHNIKIKAKEEFFRHKIFKIVNS